MTARVAVWLLGAAAIAVMLMVAAVAVTATPFTRGSSASGGAIYAASAEALADIPPDFLDIYRSAAGRFGLDWSVLAGIGKVECDHGRDPDPSCSRHGALNYAGAGGPAQFLVSTWRVYGVSATGNGAAPDMWNPADAFFSAANYLRASGAPRDYRRALFAYNPATWYVNEVLAWAQRYRGALAGSSICTGSACDVAAGGYVSPVPAGAGLIFERVDQGQDLLTDSGGGLRAIGDGYVTTAHDPGGFGPDYPVLHLTAGHFAGQAFYYGHTFPRRTGPVFAGQIIAVTGTHGVGNATVPGWAEIGLWPPGGLTAGNAIVGFLRALPRV